MREYIGYITRISGATFHFDVSVDGSLDLHESSSKIIGIRTRVGIIGDWGRQP